MILLATGAGTVITSLPRFLSEVRFALQASLPASIDQRLLDVKPQQALWLRHQRGGYWGPYGWYLAAGERGELGLRLPGRGPGVARVRLWAYRVGSVTAELREPMSGYRAAVTELDGGLVTIPAPSSGDWELFIRAESQRPWEQLVLSRFAAALVPERGELPSLRPLLLPLALVFSGWGWIAFRHGSPSWRVWLGSTGIAAAAAVGFGLRFKLFDLTRGLPLDPDAAAYMEYAERLTWFTSSNGFYSGSFGVREPLHIAALNLWTGMWGASPLIARWWSLCASVALVVTAGIFAWGVGARWFLGTAVAWVLAVNPAHIEEAVRGLRLETTSLLFLATLAAWLWGRGWSGVLLLGASMGGMALLYSPSLAIFLPWIWLGALLNFLSPLTSRRLAPPWRSGQLLLASGLALLLYAPHVYGLYKTHGDPFWPGQVYRRWNAYLEFPERFRSPTYPTHIHFAYDGPPFSSWEYLFRQHSIPALIRGQVKGWVESSAYMSGTLGEPLRLAYLFRASGNGALLRELRVFPTALLALSLGLTLLGWLRLFRNRELWWVPFLSLWGTWYAAYLYGIRLLEPFRHTGHAYPLLVFCLVWGGYELGRRRTESLSQS